MIAAAKSVVLKIGISSTSHSRVLDAPCFQQLEALHWKHTPHTPKELGVVAGPMQKNVAPLADDEFHQVFKYLQLQIMPRKLRKLCVFPPKKKSTRTS